MGLIIRISELKRDGSKIRKEVYMYLLVRCFSREVVKNVWKVDRFIGPLGVTKTVRLWRKMGIHNKI